MHIWIILFIGIHYFTTRGHCQDIKIVTYWGQNSAYGENSREEKDLVELCGEDSPFDVINVGFVEKFFDEANSDRLPGLNFAGHCNTPIDENHKTLFSCPTIERGIRTCQENGKKVLIAIGGPRVKGSFDGESQGERFAENIWNLFLGGDQQPDMRPFSSAVCDGVNILIPGGSFVGYPAFIRHLFYLTKRDKTRKYIITASPSCTFPDSVLGPAPNKALETSVKYINHLYIRFYGSACGVAENSLFEESLDAWLDFAQRMMQRDGEAPLVFVGVPAMERASPVTGCYQTTRDLREIYKRLRENKYFGGFMVWDASWDQTNIQYGKSFSERLRISAQNVEEQEQENFDENEEEEHPIEPPATAATTPITLPTTPVTYSPPAEQQPPQAPPPPTLPPSTEPPQPNTNPAPQPTDSPEEDPYGNDDEMKEGNEQPEETPEQEAPPEDEEEQPVDEEGQPPEDEEGQPPQGEDAQQPGSDEDEQEEDPYQPKPPDMENRFPQNQAEPVDDEKAYQEESIPFSQDAELIAAKAEKEYRRKQWLRLKKKEEWLKTQQSQHQSVVPSNREQYPLYNSNIQQTTLPKNQHSTYPGLAQVGKYPVMPFGFFSKLRKTINNVNKNIKVPDVHEEIPNNQKSNQPGSSSVQTESPEIVTLTIISSASGQESGSGSGSGSSDIPFASRRNSIDGSGEASGLRVSGSGSGSTDSISGSGSGSIAE